MRKPKSGPKMLDWDKVWDRFEEWVHRFEDQHKIRCKACGSYPMDYSPEWPDQQKAIQRIVESMR